MSVGFLLSPGPRLLYTILLMAFAECQPLGPNSFPRGPYLGPDFPDASILRVDETWYAFSGQRDPYSQLHVPMGVSFDFITWEHLVDDGGYEIDAMPQIPAWTDRNNPRFWAPDVTQMHDGTYTLVFSAALATDPARHCIGIATSVVPTGPFISDAEGPLICPFAQGGAVDASHFHDPGTDRHYVVYKVDGNSLSYMVSRPGTCTNSVPPIQPTPLMLQEIESLNLNLIGQPLALLDNDGILQGDQGIVAAPYLMRSAAGVYVLFFNSGCSLDDSYHIEYATSPTLTGPFVRHGVLLRSGTPTAGGTLASPGGISVHAGTGRAVFHSGYYSTVDSFRQLWTVNVEVAFNGTVTLTAT